MSTRKEPPEAVEVARGRALSALAESMAAVDEMRSLSPPEPELPQPDGLHVFRVVEAARKRGEVRVWTVEYDDVEDEACVIWAEDDPETARIICNLMNLAFDSGWAARSGIAEEEAA